MHHGQPIWVIRRPEGREPDPLGGHAFLLAGYNDVGFLVQNSWGTTWGRRGYATLPYADWLDNAYDAWVARPGVPAGRHHPAPATGHPRRAAASSLAPAWTWSAQVLRGQRDGRRGRMDTKRQGDERAWPRSPASPRR